MKKAILSVADQVFLLVDSSKFGGGYIMVVAPFDRIERVITDSVLSEGNRKLAQEKHIQVDIV